MTYRFFASDNPQPLGIEVDCGSFVLGDLLSETTQHPIEHFWEKSFCVNNICRDPTKKQFSSIQIRRLRIFHPVRRWCRGNPSSADPPNRASSPFSDLTYLRLIHDNPLLPFKASANGLGLAYEVVDPD